MLLLRRGSILSARFHPTATILGHRASSLEAKNAQFYRQGEPSRALIQTTRCNSNAAPLNAFTKTPPQNKNITYSGLKHCPDYKEALGESSKKKLFFTLQYVLQSVDITRVKNWLDRHRASAVQLFFRVSDTRDCKS